MQLKRSLLKLSLLHTAGPPRDATGAPEVLQPGKHQRPSEPDAAAADDVDAAVGGGHGSEEDVLVTEGDGAARGESYLWNGEPSNLTQLLPQNDPNADDGKRTKELSNPPCCGS